MRARGMNGWGLLRVEDIAADLGIALFVCPQGQRDGGEFVHFGDRQAVLGEVDGLDVRPTGFADFHPDELKTRDRIDAHSVIAGLSARRARDTTIIPLRIAKRAEERLLGALAFRFPGDQITTPRQEPLWKGMMDVHAGLPGIG